MDLVQQAFERCGSGLLTNALCEYVTDKTLVLCEGGSEETDVEEVTAVGSLEFVPEHRADYWVLRVHMEDELGNRLPVDEEALEAPGELSLEQFCGEILADERGTALPLCAPLLAAGATRIS